MLLHLEHEATTLPVDLEGMVDLGKVLGVEGDIHHRADDLRHPADPGFPGLPFLLFLLFGYGHLCLLGLAGSERFGAAHDFHQFLGDRRLAHLVAQQREVLDQFAGIIGGVAHGDHPSGLL